MSIIYDFAFILFALAYIPFALLKGKRLQGLSMRLGNWPKDIKAALIGQDIIWVHAVSVGEITTAVYLLRELKADFPKCKFLITTITDKGYEIAKKLFPQDCVAYLPFDISFIIKKVLKGMKLKILIIFETELWPNLICEVHKKSVPVLLANGRISDKSYWRYRIAKPLLKGVLSKIDRILMQSEEGARRIASLDAPGDRVLVAGNMKFDIDLSSEAKGGSALAKEDELGEHLASNNRVLLVAGSTHPGEERALLRVHDKLKKEFPHLQLLLAPRHIQRCSEIERLISQFGFEPKRISQLNERGRSSRCHPTLTYKLRSCGVAPTGPSPTVFLLDTVGELKHLYALADIVFVGGSLVDFGGHNMIEPAYYAKPILLGPHMANFKEVADAFLRDKAVIMVEDEPSLEKALHELMQDEEVRKALGLRARGVIERNRGATHRAVEEIRKLLKR